MRQYDAAMPPHDLEAERCVLGCMVLDPLVIDDVVLELNSEHFYADQHRRIWSALIKLHAAGTAIDSVTLARQLESTGDLAEVGGPAGLLPILQSVPHTAHVRHYVACVLDAAYRRSAIQSANRIIKAAYDSTASQEEVLQQVEQHITALVESRTNGAAVADIMSCLIDAIARIEAGEVHGLQTGFTDLDELTTGLHDGQLIVIAARPGVGKSAFAINIAHQVSESIPVLYVSLEMSRLEIAERLLALESCISVHDMRRGTLNTDQHRQLIDCANLLHSRQIFIDDTPNLSMLSIASIARLAKRRNKIGLLIVDYLQLIQPADRRLPREQQISEITRGLKCLARSLRIPVIVLAQLNREVERRNDKRPQLSDLRESGAIEQDADQVWMLHRPACHMDETDPEYEDARGRVEVYVRKNRSGRSGMAQLTWIDECMRVRNYAAPLSYEQQVAVMDW